MDTIYISITSSQSGENVAGLTDDKAYRQFLSDMKEESLMNQMERCNFIKLLRRQGCRLNRLIEITVFEPQL